MTQPAAPVPSATVLLVDDYLSKPFDPAELASRIRAVLRRARGVAQPLALAGGIPRVR
ncbi:hypothetical protein HMPREF9056_01771 [Actinomyces sp. oral taxon 170 str. F0386]|nr:hypothetical protein HMPREF9056_01771 [Actinomyces sp. oral taxon 170 str. F0386]